MERSGCPLANERQNYLLSPTLNGKRFNFVVGPYYTKPSGKICLSWYIPDGKKRFLDARQSGTESSGEELACQATLTHLIDRDSPHDNHAENDVLQRVA